MEIIKTYTHFVGLSKDSKLFESNSDLDLLKSEINDYLSSLKDLEFHIEVDQIKKGLYSFMICTSPENIFLWKTIKDDVNRFLDMSTFKLRDIKSYDGDPHSPTYYTSISKIPDNQEIIYIDLYLIK